MGRAKKDSGVKWIGAIPNRWGLVRIREIYMERSEIVSDTEYPPLSVTLNGIVPQLSFAQKTDVHDKRKLVRKGDFAINSRSDRRGACGISAYDGSVSITNTVLKPAEDIEPQYYDWLFHTSMFTDEFYRCGYGIADDLWMTSWYNMRNIYVPYPPVNEQKVIAISLNEKCAQINTAIEKSRNAVEEYRHLKQTDINNAVTKGVRGKRMMEESQYSCIGSHPAEWKEIRVKWLLTERLEYSAGGLEVPLSMSGKYGLVPTDEAVVVHRKASTRVGSKRVYRNDLVFNRMQAHTGAFSVSNYEGIVSRDYAVYYSTGISNVKFLEYLFKTPQYIAEFQKRSVGCGTGFARLYTSELFSIYCALPSLQEQEEIVAYLQTKCDEIEVLIRKEEQLLEDLKNYKNSLIYEYVTGKKNA